LLNRCVLFLLQYDKGAAYITRLFDPLAEAFSAARATALPPAQMAVLEGQLT
jgi:hypothetical protein